MKVKIDASKLIPGFDALSDEVKSQLNLGEVEVDLPNVVSKESLDKKASEAAELSKELKAKMSESERAESERLEKEKTMAQELETLKKAQTISTYKASYLSLGYDPALAEETATALVEGKTDVVFANQAKHLQTSKESIQKEILNKQPDLSSGNPFNVSQIQNAAYSEEASKAIESGNTALAASLIRQQQEKTTNKQTE